MSPAINCIICLFFSYKHHSADSKKITGNVEIKFSNLSSTTKYTIEIIDNAYKTPTVTTFIDTANSKKADTIIKLDRSKSFCWYDVSVKIKGNNIFEKRYAGHLDRKGKHE